MQVRTNWQIYVRTYNVQYDQITIHIINLNLQNCQNLTKNAKIAKIAFKISMGCMISVDSKQRANYPEMS